MVVLSLLDVLLSMEVLEILLSTEEVLEILLSLDVSLSLLDMVFLLSLLLNEKFHILV